jgi:hypothetical protein
MKEILNATQKREENKAQLRRLLLSLARAVIRNVYGFEK